MSGDQTLGFLAGAAAGVLVARPWVTAAIARAPDYLVRTNVSGRRVAAVLGLPLALGGVVGLGGVYALDRATALDLTTVRTALALCLVIVVAAGAGYADDRRGDEPARGFAGHLAAGLRGHLTGGLVKIAGVGLAGVGAGFLLGGGWYVLEVAGLVGLGANLFNLLDRAPGRAGKVALVATSLLVLFGSAVWSVAVAGLAGALLMCLVADLGERGMLGDAGANPLGAALGLGLAVSLEREGRLIALALLVAINLASERWSFSRGIERVRWLRAIDRFGRHG